MESGLLTLGVVCVVASIVGGGLKALGIELPLVRSLKRQIILAAFGVVLIVFSQLPSRSGQERKPVATELDLRVLEQQVQDDVEYGCGELANWPTGANGEALLKNLAAPLKLVEEKPLGNVQSKVIGNLYRCAGGAHLIAEGELEEKLRIGLAYLNRSVEFDPTQALLKKNIAAFQTVLTNKGGNVSVMLTNLLQVFRGNDPQIPALVSLMTEVTRSTEFQARQWLFQQATSPPIWTVLRRVQLRAKKERGQDRPIDVATKALPSGLIEVQAQIGSDVLDWEVDYAAKKFEPKNQFTSDFMTQFVAPKQ